MFNLDKTPIKPLDLHKKTKKRSEYIPIETSEFHCPVNESLDEAYNPKYYQAAKEKKVHTSHLDKINKLAIAASDAAKHSGVSHENTQKAVADYVDHYSYLQSLGYKLEATKDSSKPLKFAAHPTTKAGVTPSHTPSKLVSKPQESLADKEAKLKDLYITWYKYGEGSTNSNFDSNEEQKLYKQYTDYKKQLKDQGHQVEINSVGLNKTFNLSQSSPATPPQPKKPDQNVVNLLTSLDNLRTKMVASGYAKKETAEYDTLKATLSSQGHLPTPVPGKNWVTAYHEGLNPSTAPKPAADPWKPAPVDPEVEKHQKAVQEMHTKLAAAHPQDLKHHNPISSYTGSGSYYLNGQMRKPDDDAGHTNLEHVEKVKKLAAALSGHKAPETFHVYTGVPYSPGELHKMHFGVENTDKKSIKVHTKAFTSTSIDHKIAEKFAGKSGGPDRHVLKIRIPKDSEHGKYVAHHSQHASEMEFILKHAKNMRVHPIPTVTEHKKEWGGGTYKVYHWDTEIEPDNAPSHNVDKKPVASAVQTPVQQSQPVAHPFTTHAPASGQSKHTKAQIVKNVMAANPHMSAHSVAKIVHQMHPDISYPNASYYCNKFKKGQ